MPRDFVGDANIFARAMRRLGKLRSLLGQPRVFALIAERGRIAELALEFRHPLFYCTCLIEHRPITIIGPIKKAEKHS